jgi:hypothetical protein
MATLSVSALLLPSDVCGLRDMHHQGQRCHAAAQAHKTLQHTAVTWCRAHYDPVCHACMVVCVSRLLWVSSALEQCSLVVVVATPE